MNSSHILVAISHPVVHPEAISVAAATGLEVIDTTDPRHIARHARRAIVILAEESIAPHIHTVAPDAALFLLYAEPGPIQWKNVVQCRAHDAFILPAQASELLGRMSEITDTHHKARIHGQGMLLCVVGAVGGSGASTFAAALALFFHQRHPTVIVDADPYSAGLDLLLGVENLTGLRWSDVNFQHGDIDGEELYQSLPHTGEGIAVLAPSRVLANSGLHENSLLIAMRALVERYIVIVDIPRYADFFPTLMELTEQCILLIPAEVHAAAAAVKIKEKLHDHDVRTTIIMRHRGWSGLRTHDMERIIGQEIQAEIFHDISLAKRAELTGIAHPGFKKLPKSMQQAAIKVGAHV